MFGRQADASDGLTRPRYAVLILVYAWSMSVEVILRRNFGCRYIGLPAAVAVALIPIYALFWPERDFPAMFWFWLSYVCVAAGEALRAIRRSLQGKTAHSRYSGWPRMLQAKARMSEANVKKFIEPLMVLGIGIIILDRAPALGWYLVIASGCLFVTVLQADLWIRRRTMELNDAVFEQQVVAERFRVLRGDD